MHAHLLVWLISLLCILVRPRGIAEVWWASAGALLLLLLRLLPLHRGVEAVRQGTDVYLFLAGMMALAELARVEGVFAWIADIAARHSCGSPRRLFALVYLAGTVVTVFLSNDATAVVLTPAVLAVVRRARVAPKPHLLACALVANAASFVLPISNPANLVIFRAGMPPLHHWVGALLLPSVGSIVVTYLCLRSLSAAELTGEVETGSPPIALSPAGKLALAGLLAATLTLLVCSALNARLGAPTCIAALFATATGGVS